MVRELAVDNIFFCECDGMVDMMYLGYIAKCVGVRVSPLANCLNKCLLSLIGKISVL